MCRLDLREADCWSLRRRLTVCKARLAASAKPWGESTQQGKPTFRYSIAHAFTMCIKEKQRKEKEEFTLVSDHHGSLLRRQPGAMTIGHRPKGRLCIHKCAW